MSAIEAKKQCPSCRRLIPMGERHCTCGYDFTSPNKHPKPPVVLSTAAVLGIGIFAPCLLVAALTYFFLALGSIPDWRGIGFMFGALFGTVISLVFNVWLAFVQWHTRTSVFVAGCAVPTVLVVVLGAWGAYSTH